MLPNHSAVPKGQVLERMGTLRLCCTKRFVHFVMFAMVLLLSGQALFLMHARVMVPVSPQEDDMTLPSKSQHQEGANKRTSKNHDSPVSKPERVVCSIAMDRCNQSATKYNNSTLLHFKDESKTLALADPVLRGGYRNAMMRFTALVLYALEHGFGQILLPSLKWAPDHAGQVTIPFDSFVDVDYWNNRLGLPRLVDYNGSLHGDWDPSTGFFRTVDCRLLNKFLSGRGWDKDAIMQTLGNTTRPYGYGGGKQLGNLWVNYANAEKRQQVTLWNGAVVNFTRIESDVLNALKPSRTIQEIMSIIPHKESYLALHPRVEPDMLRHVTCQGLKVRNLTAIFEMIQNEPSFQDVEKMFVAIDMARMESPPTTRFNHGDLHEENFAILKEALSLGLKRHNQEGPKTPTLETFVGGEAAVGRTNLTDECTNSMAAAAADYEIAVKAKYFLGSPVSAWSTSVWKSRILLGNGDGNYKITRTGIEKLEGFPPPFAC